MKTQLSAIALILMLFMILLVACKGAETELGPADTYWEYYEACQAGQYEVAIEYLSENAQERVTAIGVCGFTHDAINDYELSRGGTERTFSEEPEVFEEENRAEMTWIDDTGNIAIISFRKAEDGWKIAESLWSK